MGLLDVVARQDTSERGVGRICDHKLSCSVSGPDLGPEAAAITLWTTMNALYQFIDMVSEVG